MRVIRIIVRIIRTVIRVIIVGAYPRIVIISAGSPMVPVRSVDITPSVARRQRVNAHVIICIEIDIRYVITRIADEHIPTAVDDKERIIVGGITVGMRARYRAPIGTARKFEHRMRSVIRIRCNGISCAGTAAARHHKTPRHRKKRNNQCT